MNTQLSSFYRSVFVFIIFFTPSYDLGNLYLFSQTGDTNLKSDSSETMEIYIKTIGISVITSSLMSYFLWLIWENQKRSNYLISQDLDPKILKQQFKQFSESHQQSQTILYNLDQNFQKLEERLSSLERSISRIKQGSEIIDMIDDLNLESKDIPAAIIQEYNQKLPLNNLDRVTTIEPGSQELKPDPQGKYQVQKQGDNLFIVPSDSFRVNKHSSSYIAQVFDLRNYDEDSRKKQEYKLIKPAKIISGADGIYKVLEKGVLDFEIHIPQDE